MHANIVSKVGAAVLKDIEGLDPSVVGFERPECCGPLPPKLPGSFEPLMSHAFMSSNVPAVEWDKTCSNVKGFNEFAKAYKSIPRGAATVYHDASQPASDASSVIVFRFHDGADANHRVSAVEYTGSWEAGEMPWNGKGVVSVERSDEIFIFVCAHRRRDDRCGYCGPMLVELIKQAVTSSMPAGEGEKVHVLPCSHIGGHVYAGNVLVYSKRGGVCFGCFCPPDIPALVESIATQSHDVPESLKARVRGVMGPGN
mmetsp:Transcript_39222/g.45607  ORF Transcript_39222/g.45607 Transcript_39222/m.45607 type:complete len:256 (-) Transcript_39222:367-1134(-)